LTARNLEENRITASPHPAFSPPLAASDFFLFGALKDQLSGRIFESPNQLVEAIRQIASAIPQMTLERVFLKWEKDCCDVLTSILLISTKVYDSMLYSLRFLL
jgi:hypothetical protein